MAGPILGNNKQYSWGSVVLVFDAGRLEIEGYAEVTWSHKRTRTKGYGQGRHHAPQVRTSGKYEIDNVKFSFRVDHADAVREHLKAQAPDRRSYGNVAVPIMVQLVEPEAVSTLEFREATLASEGGSLKEGPEGLMEDLEFDVMGALVNGGTLYDSSEPNAPL
jgi:hypothetical protein